MVQVRQGEDIGMRKRLSPQGWPGMPTLSHCADRGQHKMPTVEREIEGLRIVVEKERYEHIL